ncbi:MAG: SOS response-associated peptidase family protein, partial [Candidatus Heimdallarchaeota archaeon]
PAIIPPSAFDTWLDPSPESQERALALLKPFEAQKLEAYPVGDYVNNTKNEGEQCILPKSDRYKQQKLF